MVCQTALAKRHRRAEDVKISEGRSSGEVEIFGRRWLRSQIIAGIRWVWMFTVPHIL
jgi:hypothetical protein